MEDSPWNEILFFPGEDAEALKSRFIELCAVHKMRYTAHQVATHVFKNLRDPLLRAGRAAQVWGEDLDTQERIRVLMLKGPDVPDCTESDLIRRSLAVCDHPSTSDKDKLAAIRLAGELQGFVKKSVDLKTSNPVNDNANEFLAALSAKLPN